MLNGYAPGLLPITNEIIKIIKNTTNNILAIPVAAPAIPLKPRTAATNAIIKKIIAHLNILIPPKCRFLIYLTIFLCCSKVLLVLEFFRYKFSIPIYQLA